MIFGYYILEGEKTWGALIAYILVLLYIANSVQSLLNYLASLSLFYAQVNDYIHFLSITQPLIRRERKALSDKSMQIRVTAKQPLHESQYELTVWRDNPIYFNCGKILTRIDSVECFSPLLEATSIAKEFWYTADLVSNQYDYLPGSLKNNLFDGEQNVENSTKITSALTMLDLDNEVSLLPKGLDTLLTTDVWNNLSHLLKAAIRVLPALLSESEIIFLDQAIFGKLSKNERYKFLALLGQKFVFIVVNKAKIDDTETLPTIIVRQGKIIGMGNVKWFNGIRNELSSYDKQRAESVDAQDESLIDL